MSNQKFISSCPILQTAEKTPSQLNLELKQFEKMGCLYTQEQIILGQLIKINQMLCFAIQEMNSNDNSSLRLYSMYYVTSINIIFFLS